MAYEKEIENMRFSYSRLTTFEHCKYEFYLQYIVNDDDIYLSEGNYYAEVGSFIHLVLEKIFKGEIKIEDALDYYLDNFDDNVLYKVKESIMDKKYMSGADYFTEVESLFEWLKDYEIIGVEQECKFKLCGRKFIGYIDLLLRDKRDGRYVVLDHKSSAYPIGAKGGVLKRCEKDFEKYKKQMYLYSHFVKEQYGEFPKSIIWNHFFDSKFNEIPFDEKEYDAAIKWFEDSIENIRKEENFEPNKDFFYCHNLCNFRNSCEENIE